LPEGAEYDRLVQRMMNNEIIRGKLLSEDGQLTLIVLALDPDVVTSSRLREVIGEIQKTIDNDWLKPSSLGRCHLKFRFARPKQMDDERLRRPEHVSFS